MSIGWEKFQKYAILTFNECFTEKKITNFINTTNSSVTRPNTECYNQIRNNTTDVILIVTVITFDYLKSKYTSSIVKTDKFGEKDTGVDYEMYLTAAKNLEQIWLAHSVQRQFFSPLLSNSSKLEFFKSKAKISYSWYAI